MNTLIEIDKNLLHNYSDWERVNEGKWNISSYLNEFYDINAALAFSKFFFPDFVEIEGCVILGFRYNPKTFKQWKDEFGDNKSAIEMNCNLYDVGDYFHINKREERIFDQQVNELALVMKKSWEINCNLLYPNREYVVDVFVEYDVTRITLYRTNNDI